MGLRLALYELAAREGLNAASARRLQALAGLDGEPAQLRHALARGVGLLAAALGALGLICWVAAHWQALGRGGRFALLQGVLLVTALGAAALPAARRALALAAWGALGALLAYFGQTYQTGADPWQLFALWALLSLPLALAVRSDALWLPWTLVAMAALGLWLQTQTGPGGRPGPHDLAVHAAGWLAGAALVGALAPPLRRWSGAGVWSLRGAVVLWVLLLTGTALGGLFGPAGLPRLGLGAGLLALAAVALASPRGRDIHGLSAVALGLDTLLVARLAQALLGQHRGDPTLPLLLLGLAAAALLALTVGAILALVRREGVRA